MTWKQFVDALETLGYSQVEFAREIGVSDRTVRNWAGGRWPVPRQTALLLEFMLAELE